MSRRIDGLQWSSVGAYLNWINAYLGLSPVNVSDVWNVRVTASFKVARRRKMKTLKGLEENLAAVKEYIARNSEHDGGDELEVTKEELMVLGTMIGNYEFYIGILTDQLDSLTALEDWEQASLEYVSCGVEDGDEIPF
jgi:hypothetical protein